MRSSVPLGASGSVLGGSWGGLGGFLGRSWGDLGASGRVLGPLGAALGPLGAVFWRYVGTVSFFNYFWHDIGSILRFKSLPKRFQNGAQNGPRSNTKFNIKKEDFQDPLGTVLGLPWVDLGSKSNQN